MDIKEYIKESLRQIVELFKEVQSEVVNKSQKNEDLRLQKNIENIQRMENKYR